MKLLISVLLLFTLANAHAYVEGSMHPDSLLNKTYVQRRIHLITHYQIMDWGRDSAMAHLNRLDSFARQHNDQELVLEMELLRTYYAFYHDTANDEDMLAFINMAKQKVKNSGNVSIEARLHNAVAMYYLNIKHNYARGFEHALIEYSLVQKLKDEEYPEKRQCLLRIIDYYYLFRDYHNAILYLRKLLQVKLPVVAYSEDISAYNTIGLCYQKTGERDSALYYFNLVHSMAVAKNEEQWQGIANGNIGAILFEEGKYQQAIPLLENDVALSVERSDWCCASGSQMLLADIYLKQRNPAKANQLLQLAANWVNVCGQYDRYAILYPLLSKLNSQLNKPQLASLYVDSTVWVKDSLVNKYNILQLARVRQEAELKNYNEELERIETEKQVKVLQRNALIAIMLVLLALTIYIYIAQRKRYVQQQLLSEFELNAKKQELEAAQLQLHEFARSISDKSKLIEELEQQMNLTVDENIISELQQKTILTDADWEHFRLLFDKVHAGYLQRLRQKLPGLTPAEERFMALAKLRFSVKEMAGALGISQQAVRNIWYRLRKKLNLPEEGSVEELVEQI